jgi:hypothetical protein
MSEVYETKRTIEEVFDMETGEIINSKEFFKKPESEIFHYRRLLESAIKGYTKPRFVCIYCHHLVKITGKSTRRGKVSYFSHLYDSEECEVKTDNLNKLTKKEIEVYKYIHQNESERHKNLKLQIFSFLESSSSVAKGVKSVAMEKRIKSQVPELNWKQPDISFTYKGLQFVIELQLSTTFLSVIVERDYFYKLHKIFIIWVFNFSDNTQYVNLENMMCKDIYYNNKRNAFILDDQSIELSKAKAELVLKCLWFEPKFENGFINPKKSIKKVEYISLSDLKLDDSNFKPYFIDADKLFEHQKLNLTASNGNIDSLYECKIRRFMNLSNSRLNPYKIQKKWGFLNAQGEIVVDPIYNDVEICDQRFTYVSKNGWGVINEYGHEIIKTKYKTIKRIENDYFIASIEKTFILDRYLGYENTVTNICDDIYDEIGNLIIDGINLIRKEYLVDGEGGYVYTMQDCYDSSYQHFCYNRNFRYIFLKFEGTPIVCKNGIAKVIDINDNYESHFVYGCINTKGQIVVPFIYDEIRDFVGKYAICRQAYENMSGQKLGMIDVSGNEIIPFIYSEFNNFNKKGKAIVRCSKGKKYGVINIKGEIIIPLTYEYIYEVEVDIFICIRDYGNYEYIHGNYECINGNYEVIDGDNGIELLNNYSYIEHVKNLHFIVKKDNKYFVVNKFDERLTQKYDDLTIIENEYLYCYNYRNCGIIKMDGTEIVPMEYYRFSILKNKNIIVCKQRKYGVINKYGNIIVPIIYDDLTEIGEKLLRSELNQNYGIMNSDGIVIELPTYKELKYIKNNSKDIEFFIVRKDDKCGMFDIQFQEVLPLIFNEIENSNGYLYIQLDDKWGIASLKGEIIVPIKYPSKKLANCQLI